MLEALETYIKLAVDVQRRVVAGGGELHADCEAMLLEDGSEQESIWGVDWIPESQEVRFEAMINIRPARGNRSMSIQDEVTRALVRDIVMQRLSG
jgi:hypothetical protein